jgi:alpha-beta hydrolase superfamily lysophospholipase
VLTALIVCPDAWAQRQRRAEIENLKLTTKDGVELAITYYPSTEGKSAVPVVILHDSKETRQTYSELAKRLNRPDNTLGDTHKSFAVVTVDLRGHGESITQTLGNRSRELSASKLRGGDYAAMVLQDVEAVRKFLLAENEKGKLNLNSLSMIGVGLGAAVGMNWTAKDWAAPPLATGKQGQDVKTLVVVSPRWKENGLSVQNAVRQPGLRNEVAVLMLYGKKDRKVNADVERIEKQLSDNRQQPDATSKKLPDLLEIGVDTELQGDKWLKQEGEKGTQLIIRFLDTYSVQPEHPWTNRKPF